MNEKITLFLSLSSQYSQDNHQYVQFFWKHGKGNINCRYLFVYPEILSGMNQFLIKLLKA